MESYGEDKGVLSRMKKRVLILNGSISEIPLIEEAKKLGCYVITTGNAPELPGHKYADEYVKEDYSNKEAILALVKKHNIDGIVSCANDFGAITAAYVCEKMGWNGHDTYENTLLLHQKDRFKTYFYENHIPSPRSVIFENEQDAIEYAKTAAYPVISKAVDLTGGKGIRRADNYEEAKAAIRESFERSRKKHIVIEPFIEGHQESIDAFVIDHKVVQFVTNNCYMPINPYLIQTEILPSDYEEQVKDELCKIIEMICSKLDLVDGIFTLQYIVQDEKPYVIELMRRNLGNQYLTLAEKQTGFPWFKAVVMSELGMDCSTLQATQERHKNVGHHGVMSKCNGIFKSMSIAPELEKHIFQRIDMIQPGEEISDYMNERISYLYYCFEDREELLEMVEKMNDLIKVEVES